MISVLCPSRGRPVFARELLESIRATSVLKFVELILRLDDDDPFLGEYLDQVSGTDVTTIVGGRVVLSQCWNEAAAKAQNDVLMLCGDDIRFRTQGWDSYVLQTIYSVPDRILLVHGRDGIQDDKVATHPFLHRRWMETVGYFVPPLFASDYNDMWLTEVADAIGRRRYLPYVYTEHLHPAAGKYYLDQTHIERLTRHRWYDCDRIYRDTVQERRADADKLRAVLQPMEEVIMSANPDQNQPAPDPIDYHGLGPTDSPTPEQRQAAEQADDAAELKGEALDKALEEAGLPKSGTADEKRARLAENQG
jgi:hypothetical protein